MRPWAGKVRKKRGINLTNEKPPTDAWMDRLTLLRTLPFVELFALAKINM